MQNMIPTSVLYELRQGVALPVQRMGKALTAQIQLPQTVPLQWKKSSDF